MKVTKNDRGFRQLVHPVYVESEDSDDRIVAESSAIGDYEDSYDNPGSSFLWIAEHHLNREEVKDLVKHLQYWLKNGRLNLVE